MLLAALLVEEGSLLGGLVMKLKFCRASREHQCGELSSGLASLVFSTKIVESITGV
jgi:hypothetical protein